MLDLYEETLQVQTIRKVEKKKTNYNWLKESLIYLIKKNIYKISLYMN